MHHEGVEVSLPEMLHVFEDVQMAIDSAPSSNLEPLELLHAF